MQIQNYWCMNPELLMYESKITDPHQHLQILTLKNLDQHVGNSELLMC